VGGTSVGEGIGVGEERGVGEASGVDVDVGNPGVEVAVGVCVSVGGAGLDVAVGLGWTPAAQASDTRANTLPARRIRRNRLGCIFCSLRDLWTPLRSDTP
jgi:hypothetical protein